ncbi:permease prefix domain 1-containing protein [Aquibacillus rhizosphaerae]|uniref:Permease prefix domain 1-containing protein n=1 Tax=Aquibacillus rhizosphaerae TaxID=3051431 RepID=A0ABT7L4U0_9BACI|nr:permease prefix domain 1-containing protein [Aquibacillus sp. LR5S19]MDL4840864.1 permease prefix domain 1-containing protein [Aquibacillus sp. LR5S19]
MSSKMERYVKQIVEQTECSKDEKDDLYEELFIHLQLSQEQFVKEGLSEPEAEEKAIEDFGQEDVIGDQLQQAMFPYRREMLLGLSMASILFTISVYLSQLITEGDAYIPWLLISISISSLLLFISLNKLPQLNRKRWTNSILIIHLLVYLYGWSLASGIDHIVTVVLVLWAWLIILLSLFLVYRTTLHDFQPNGNPLSKKVKLLHVINMTIGIIIIGLTLFFLWAMLAFSGGIELRMLLFGLPFVIWVVLYIAQMKLVKKNKKSAFFMTAISILIVLSIVFYSFIMPMFIY